MEFSPDVCTGEASDPPGGFSAALCFPLSCRLEVLDLVLTILTLITLDLVSTILPCFPTDGANLFRKETERIEESRIVLRGWPGAALTWLEMISRLLTPAQRTAPGVFPEETPPTIKSDTKDEQISGK